MTKKKHLFTHLLRPNDVQTSAFAHYPVAVKYSYEIVMGTVGKVKKKASLAGRENLSSLWAVTNRVTSDGTSMIACVGDELSAAIRRKRNDP